MALGRTKTANEGPGLFQHARLCGAVRIGGGGEDFVIDDDKIAPGLAAENVLERCIPEGHGNALNAGALTIAGESQPGQGEENEAKVTK